MTCQYEGKDYSEGSLICKNGRELKCSSEEWIETGFNCDEVEATGSRSRSAYVFSTNQPPRLRDYPDSVAIDPNLLVQHVAQTSVVIDTLDFPGHDYGGLACHRTGSTTFIRTRRWGITFGPVHHAWDEPTHLKAVLGYKKEQVASFTRETGFSVEGKYGPLTASLRESLKYTESTSEEWREEYTEEKDVNFLSNHTYIVWTLYDILTAIRSTHDDKVSPDGNTLIENMGDTVNTFSVAVAVKIWQDALEEDRSVDRSVIGRRAYVVDKPTTDDQQ